MSENESKLFPKIGETVEEEFHNDVLSNGVMRVESMCVNCEENGETRLLLVHIPHFREVIVSSFSCDECGYQNQEIQFGGKFGDKGVHYELELKSPKDLNRQIVKSDYCTFSIPHLDFEIPPLTQRGKLNTIEGMIMNSIDDLSKLQPVRKIQNIEMYNKVEAFLSKLRTLINNPDFVPFKIILDDPSGNSNVENPLAPKTDPQLSVRYYDRSDEQDKMIGLNLTHEDDVNNTKEEGTKKEEEAETAKEQKQTFNVMRKKKGIEISEEDAQKLMKNPETKEASFDSEMNDDTREVMIFPEECYNCHKMGECRMVLTNIPHFKEVVVMAFACNFCGFKTNEIKSGGSISEKGKRIELKLTDPEDLNRSILKAESASVHFVELDFEISEGSMGGKFTTIEGLITSLIEAFEGMFQFKIGDSSNEKEEEKQKLQKFLDSLDALKKGKEGFTLVLDDPMGNSYIQNIYAPDDDPNMKITEYERTKEQNDDFGISDMKTENYQ